MKITIVVPVRNEQDNIQPQVNEILAVLDDGLDFEIVYVDDGSTDGTLDKLREARAQSKGRLRVLVHEGVCGQSTAIYSGVKAARHPWIVTLDGDGQNDPSDIPALLESARTAGSETIMVTGERVKRQDTWLRRLSSRIANYVRRTLLRDATPDTGCGLKVFRRDLFLDLPYFDHMHRFLSALVLRQGGQIISVPVSHRPRTRGRSKYGVHNRLWVGIVDMLGVAWLQRREKRHRRVTEVGAGEERKTAAAGAGKDNQGD
jgi:dolichol-phosphate mannosyltransferase